MSDIQKLAKIIRKFIEDRDWKPYHNPKDLAISISLESNELLEHFQWKNPEEVVSYVASHREDIADEMADVFTYLIQFAGAIDVDLFDTTLRKLEKSAEKYPVEKSKGNHKKYTEL